jgi:Bacteriophage Mu, GemA protein
MPVSKRQLAFIHVATAKLKPTDEKYRTALVQIARATCATELDQAGFDAIIGFFEYLGFCPAGAQGKNFGPRPGMASFAQIELIRAMWHEYTHAAYRCEAELNKWLERSWKISSLRFLTAAQAPRVIIALKRMKTRAK